MTIGPPKANAGPLLPDETAGGGLFPRVTPCADGSFCCNNSPQCCSNGQGVFMDSLGHIVSSSVSGVITSYPPVDGTGVARFTVTPTTSTSTFPGTSTPSTTSDPGTSLPASSPPSQTAVSSSVDTVGLKVGLGLGIPLAVLVSVCAFILFSRWWRRRRREQDLWAAALIIGDGALHEAPGLPVKHQPPSEMYAYDKPVELSDGTQPRFELEGS